MEGFRPVPALENLANYKFLNRFQVIPHRKLLKSVWIEVSLKVSRFQLICIDNWAERSTGEGNVFAHVKAITNILNNTPPLSQQELQAPAIIL